MMRGIITPGAISMVGVISIPMAAARPARPRSAVSIWVGGGGVCRHRTAVARPDPKSGSRNTPDTRFEVREKREKG